MIDTPGHVDFSPEMERAVQVMDYAVLVVSAVEGVQGHTETVWQMLRKNRIPTFIFINKTDRTGADVERVLEEIRIHLTADACMLTGSLRRRPSRGSSDGKSGGAGRTVTGYFSRRCGRSSLLVRRHFRR